jgi:hypothetical protein
MGECTDSLWSMAGAPDRHGTRHARIAAAITLAVSPTPCLGRPRTHLGECHHVPGSDTAGGSWFFQTNHCAMPRLSIDPQHRPSTASVSSAIVLWFVTGNSTAALCLAAASHGSQCLHLRYHGRPPEIDLILAWLACWWMRWMRCLELAGPCHWP